MRTFEISMKAFTSVIVTAEDEEQALDLATEVCDAPRGWEFDESNIEEELQDPKKIAQAVKDSAWHRNELLDNPVEPAS